VVDPELQRAVVELKGGFHAADEPGADFGINERCHARAMAEPGALLGEEPAALQHGDALHVAFVGLQHAGRRDEDVAQAGVGAEQSRGEDAASEGDEAGFFTREFFYENGGTVGGGQHEQKAERGSTAGGGEKQNDAGDAAQEPDGAPASAFGPV